MTKHKITVNLDWQTMEKDIKAKIYRTAKTEEGNVNDSNMEALLARAVTGGVSDLVEICGNYIWDNAHVSDNAPVNNDTVTVILMMPMNFNLAGCKILGRMMHSYIVVKALKDWFIYSQPKYAEELENECARISADIRKTLNARTRMPRAAKEIVIYN